MAWYSVEKAFPPENQPVLAMHSEYANPVVMLMREETWWIAHASGALGSTQRISSPLLWTPLPSL